MTYISPASGFDFVWLAAGVSKAGLTSTSYVDLDLSGDIPVGARGLCAVATRTSGSGGGSFYFRPNGSSDTLIRILSSQPGNWIMVPLDANRIFDYKVNAGTWTLLLVAYWI